MELKRLWRKRGFLLKLICCFADKVSAGGVAGHPSGLIGKGRNPPQPSPDTFSSGKVASLTPPTSTTNFLKSASGYSPGILRYFSNLRLLFQRIFEIVIPPHPAPLPVQPHIMTPEKPHSCLQGAQFSSMYFDCFLKSPY